MTADQKVADYLTRARQFMVINKEDTDVMALLIEIAKMIQLEELHSTPIEKQ